MPSAPSSAVLNVSEADSRTSDDEGEEDVDQGRQQTRNRAFIDFQSSFGSILLRCLGALLWYFLLQTRLNIRSGFIQKLSQDATRRQQTKQNLVSFIILKLNLNKQQVPSHRTLGETSETS